MSRDTLIGIVILVLSVVGIVTYNWLLFFTEWGLMILKITAFIAVTGVLAIFAWIGYTLATTPPPKPIEEIEKELEKELKTEEEKK
ncbi:MAG: transcriptional regulator [Thaumarchaeota archaeon]|nr:transcriptional regulator [Candidatus Geocrenenecus arthurdayi]MCL7396656.1 transcriptional regulator [Candidatus Geocrenenecus arthurdayi]MCL7403242.1 transcriptional regulator [Candidatus Geocrenenecus arthurdayi]